MDDKESQLKVHHYFGLQKDNNKKGQGVKGKSERTIEKMRDNITIADRKRRYE